MPYQNRVLPTGEIVATGFRGALMGNRGILHDDEGRLGRARWRHRAWIACLLSFKNRHRIVMTPRRYTELFFFDEAVALAAGHRPCAECRRADYNRFREAWRRAYPGDPPSADAMDRSLHEARIDPGTRGQRTFAARLADLPEGVFVKGGDGEPQLLWGGQLHAYQGERYGESTPIAPNVVAAVLTPRPMVDVMRAGYRPTISALT